MTALCFWVLLSVLLIVPLKAVAATPQDKVEQIKAAIDQGKYPAKRSAIISLLGTPLRTQSLAGVDYLLYETEKGEFYLFVVVEHRPDIGYKKVDPKDPYLDKLFSIKVDEHGMPLDAKGRRLDLERRSPQSPDDPTQILDEATRANLKRADEFYIQGMATWDKRRAIESYNKAIELNPSHYMAHVDRGYLYYSLGEYRSAFEDLDTALALKPNSRLYNLVAWLLTTCKDPQYRDPHKAILYANKAISLAEDILNNRVNIEASFHHTLAAAYAELGDFQKAVHEETRAYETYAAENRDEEQRRQEFRQLIEAYKNRQTYLQWIGSRKVPGHPLGASP